ncbi:hypothetical protein AAC387_Pa05g3887 [Persea americana]
MSCQYPPSSSPLLISKCLVFPEKKSTLPDLKLSVSDLPMLSCHYIQKGVLLPPSAPSPFPSDATLLSHLRRSLSHTLTHFPPLAGRLTTHPSSGHIFITCNDAGVDFIHATAHHLTVRDEILSPVDVPESVRGFFSFASDGIVSYQGHFRPLLAVQVTELSDGVFIGCAVNHAVTDGTSFWNFFNAFAEVSRGVERISRPPDFRRDLFNDSAAVLKLPEGGPVETFSSCGADGVALRERIFHFRREAILDLKSRSNAGRRDSNRQRREVEMMGKENNDVWGMSLRRRGLHEEEEETGGGGRLKAMMRNSFISRDDADEISSFQSLCAQVWRSVTRARRLPRTAETTFRMAVNWRHRVEPRLDPWYFGNAIQSVATRAQAGEVAWRDLGWSAGLLHESVRRHGDARVRGCVEEWEKKPRCFPLGNQDGASITMGSSPRFPMYDNDFGWGGPIAVRSGTANKFDGKMSAFPGGAAQGGDGSVDLEVCLSQDTMAALEADPDFMQYVYVVEKAN